jgi:hypothetical protein
MAAASVAQKRRRSVEAIDTTLLDLVWSVGEVTSSDHEVIATVSSLLRYGAVKLCGNFRDCPIECLLEQP